MGRDLASDRISSSTLPICVARGKQVSEHVLEVGQVSEKCGTRLTLVKALPTLNNNLWSDVVLVSGVKRTLLFAADFGFDCGVRHDLSGFGGGVTHRDGIANAFK